MYKDFNGNWHPAQEVGKKPSNHSVPRISLPSRRILILIGSAIALVAFFLITHRPQPTPTLVPAPTANLARGKLCTGHGSSSPAEAVADTIFTLKTKGWATAALCYPPGERAFFSGFANLLAPAGYQVTFASTLTLVGTRPTTVPGASKGELATTVTMKGVLQECLSKAEKTTCSGVPLTKVLRSGESQGLDEALTIKNNSTWYLSLESANLCAGSGCPTPTPS